MMNHPHNVFFLEYLQYWQLRGTVNIF